MSCKAAVGTTMLAFGILVGSVGCATIENKVAEQRKEMKESLCNFDGKRPTTLITHLDNSGGTIEGDVRQDQTGEFVWASALATTKKSVAIITTTSTIVRVVPQCNYWGQCVWIQVPVKIKDTEIESLGDIYGLGRVPVEGSRRPNGALYAAAKLARENCKSMAEDFAERTSGISKYSRSLKCVVLDKQICR